MTMTATPMPGTDVEAATAALRGLADTAGGEVLAGQLSRLVTVIANEALRTERFRSDLVAALVPEPASSDGPAAPVSKRKLEGMTKAQLKKLIDSNGMDPDRTLRSRTTKGEMIELILAFRRSESEPVQSADEPAETPQVDASAPDAVPPAAPPKRRRRPSTLDPYSIAASDGVEGLRQRLKLLDVEQLKDVIAEYGMNSDGRAMSWNDHHRFVERIIEKVDFGTTQGSAFRTSG